MSEKSLYHIIKVDLAEKRTKSQPYEITVGKGKDYIYILSLTGTAQASIYNGEFFDLAQGMKIVLEKDQRQTIEVVNPSQVNKNLIFFIGTQGKCEVEK